MLNIIYIFFLILVMIFISPIVDHLMPYFDNTKDNSEIILEITLQLISIGLIVYIFILVNETNIIKNTFRLVRYDRMLIDLIFTIVLIGTQKNLTKKLKNSAKN